MRALIIAVVALGGCRVNYDPLGADAGPANVQTGTAAILDADSSARVDIDPIDLDRALLTFGTAVDAPEPDDVFIRGELLADEIVFSRDGTESEASLRWYVSELPAGSRVQRGSLSMDGGTDSATIDPVDLGSSFPVFSSRVDGTDFSEDDMVRVELFDDRLDFTIEDPDTTRSVEWQVVTIPGARVEAGIAVLDDADTVAVATPTLSVDRTRALLRFSHSCNAANLDNIADKMVSGVIESDGSLTFERGVAGSQVTVSWFLVELPGGFAVQSAATAIPEGQATASASLEPIDPALSFAMAGYHGAGGRVDATSGDTPGGAWVTAELVGGDTLELTRASSVGNAEIGWFVVELPATPGGAR